MHNDLRSKQVCKYEDSQVSDGPWKVSTRAISPKQRTLPNYNSHDELQLATSVVIKRVYNTGVQLIKWQF